MPQQYSITEIETIAFNGFNYSIPQDVLDIITNLSMKVGSPAYIKTPVFQKKEQTKQPVPVRRRRQKESVNTEWESPTVQVQVGSVLAQKDGIDIHINKIRVCLNKLSETSYVDILSQITDILNTSIIGQVSEEDLFRVGNMIFEIASNNKFYSKLYAKLYTELIQLFQPLYEIFNTNYDSYLTLFKNIQYVDPDENYDQFCVNNATNERRKAVSAFFVNLTLNGVMTSNNLIRILKDLFETILAFIVQPNKSNEVCELIENISILYDPKVRPLYEGPSILVETTVMSGTFAEVLSQLAKTKVKTYPSLSSKTIFKCMDLS
jgi:hypothetical protein